MRGPAQISNRLRGQFLVRSAGPAGIAAQQFPEYRQAHSLLSANVAACVASNRTASNAPQWVCLSIDPHSVQRTAFTALDFAALRCLSMSEVLDASTNLEPNSAVPVYVGPETIGAGPAGTGPDPLALWSGRYSNAKLRIRFSDGTDRGRVIVCDVGGGFTLCYCATHVGVDLLLPVESVVAPPNQSGLDVEPLAPTTGSVEDFVVEASMTLTEGGGLLTGNVATLSISRQIGGNDEAIFKIPSGVDVASIVSTTDSISADWMNFIDAGGVPVRVGSYRAASFDGAAYSVPRTARHLMISNLTPTDQDVTVVWTLET